MGQLASDSEPSLGGQIGPYRLGNLLGQGGMGRVYRATREDSGRVVALKVVLQATSSRVAALQQEVGALSRTHHPGIVGLVEFGREGQFPWYAMDLLQGPTLYDALRQRARGWPARAETETEATQTGAAVECDAREEAPAESGTKSAPDSSPRPVRAGAGIPWLRQLAEFDVTKTVRVFGGLASALAHLHHLGLRHGDLKPDNVFLTSVEQPVLVDLGLAGPVTPGHEQLELRPSHLGSVAYMAPEQLTHGHADLRADLYALGCLMYEWIAGKHPFGRLSREAMRLAHVEQPLTPLAQVAPDVPQVLCSLVERLLTKDPRDRYGSAEEVLAVLHQLGDIDRSAPARSPRGLFRSPFVGRGGALQAVVRGCHRARKGDGSTLTVCGERGCGKTRLLNEAATLARGIGLNVVGLRSGDDSTALEDLFWQLDVLATDASLSTDALRAQLSGLRGAAQAGPELPSARRQLVAAIARAVMAQSGQRALVVLVDDADAAGELCQELVSRLAAEAANHNMLLLLSQCEPAVSPSLNLGPLDANRVHAMARAMLGVDSLPGELSEFLDARAGGNPRLVGEWMRSAIAGGVLVFAEQRAWRMLHSGLSALDGVVTAPELLLELVGRRLPGLSPSAEKLLQAACIIGESFESALAEHVSGLGVGEYQGAVSDLLTAGVLAHAPDDHLRFVYPALRERLMSRVDSDARAVFHGLAASYLGALQSPTAAQFEAHGRHLLALDRVSESVVALERGARLAISELRFREAARLLSLAASLVADSGGATKPEQLRINETLGDVCQMLQRERTAIEAYSRALALSFDELDAARLECKLAQTVMSEPDAARAWLASALRHVGHAPPNARAPAAPVWLQIRLTQMLSYYFSGQVEELLELAALVEPLAESVGTLQQLGQFLGHRAFARLRLLCYRANEDVERDLERAMSVFQQARDRQGVGMTGFLMNMARLFSDQEDKVADACAGFEQALAVGVAVSDVTLQLRAKNYLCISLRRMGQLQRCRRLSSELRSQAEEHQHVDYVGAAIANLAWAALRDGQLGQAAELARESFAVWDEASSRYPFSWTAAMPWLVALAERDKIDADDTRQAAWLAGRLLAPLQCWLPEALHSALLEVELEPARFERLRGAIATLAHGARLV